jgi:hypothetical protein
MAPLSDVRDDMRTPPEALLAGSYLRHEIKSHKDNALFDRSMTRERQYACAALLRDLGDLNVFMYAGASRSG